MTQHLIRQGLNVFLLFAIVIFLILTLFSALGQQFLPRIDDYRNDIQTYLQQDLGADVRIAKLWGDMQVLTPKIHIENLTYYGEDKTKPQLYVAAIDAVLDLHQSLASLAPVFKSVRLSGVSLDLRSVSETRDELASNTEDEVAGGLQTIIQTLMLQPSIDVTSIQLLFSAKGKEQSVQFENLSLKGDGFRRLLNGHVIFGDKEKSSTSFRMYSEGDPYDLGSFYARGTLELPGTDVAQLLDAFMDEPFVKTFSTNAHLHFEFDEGLLKRAKLELASEELELSSGTKFSTLAGSIWLEQTSLNEWRVWLERGQFTFESQPWLFNNVGVSLSRKPQGNRWQISAESLNLKDVNGLLASLNLLPDKLNRRLQELDPSGDLLNAVFILDADPEARSEFTFAGQLSGVSVKPSQGIPGISNVSGVVAANKQSGRVQFDGQDMALIIPNIYENDIELPQASGQVEWFIQKEQIRIVADGFNLQAPDVSKVAGGFQLWLPFNKKIDRQLLLNLSLENAKAEAHKTLTPTALDAGLLNWLDKGINGGVVPNGQLLFFGSISQRSDPSLELHLSIKNGQLSYLDEWPSVNSIEGHLLVEEHQVLARIDQANTLGGKANLGTVVFEKGIEGKPNLWVGIEAEGPAQQALDYLVKTPLSNVVGDVFREWKVTGDQTFSMGLKVPMGDRADNVAVDLSLGLSQNHLDLGPLGLRFEALEGQLNYSSAKGLNSEQLKGQFWQRPVTVNISSSVVDGLVSTFAFNGRMDTQGLKGWTKLALLESLHGESDVTGSFILDTRKGQSSQLIVNSDLNGIEIRLPEPYGLKETNTRNVDFVLNVEDPLSMDINYGDQVSAVIALKNGELYSGDVVLGPHRAVLPQEQGLKIKGHVDVIQIEYWKSVWDRIQHQQAMIDLQSHGLQSAPDHKRTNENPISRIQLTTNQVKYEEHLFENVNVDIQQNAGDWRADIDAPIAKGTLFLPKQSTAKADFVYLHLPAPKEMLDDQNAQQQMLATQSTESKIGQEPKIDDPLSDLRPTDLVDLDLKVGEIFIGPINYGEWDVSLRPERDLAKLVINQGEIKNLQVSGDLLWKKADFEFTQANLVLKSDDVGDIQRQWRLKPTIESEKAKAELSLIWRASPAGFNFSTLSGDASFKLQDGSFVEAKDAEALNAFGLLNFASIGRRLRLDFSDLYQDGLHFDVFEAKTKLNDGIVQIVDTMRVVGPAARFEASGTINLNNKELDQELSVTFPVSSTLPLVAIIAGLSPPVAASIFIGERLVGDEIERFTSATYTIQGIWDDPDLNLKKRFDNEIEGKRNRTFWHRMKDIFSFGDN